MKFHSLLRCGIFSACCVNDADLFPSCDSDVVILDAQSMFEENSTADVTSIESSTKEDDSDVFEVKEEGIVKEEGVVKKDDVVKADEKKEVKEEDAVKEEEKKEIKAKGATKKDKKKKEKELKKLKKLKEPKELKEVTEVKEVNQEAKEEKQENNIGVAENFGHYSLKNLLFLAETDEENNNVREPKSRVNLMAEMKQMMTDFFGAWKKDKIKDDKLEMLEHDDLNEGIYEEVPEKRELNPSVLLQLKNLVQELLDNVTFDRIKEVDYSSEDDDDLDLSKLTIVQVEKNEFEKLQTVAKSESEPDEDEIAVLPTEDDKKKNTLIPTGVKELKQMAREYLHSIGINKFEGKKIKKVLNENKSLVIKIVKNALDTIDEEETSVDTLAIQPPENTAEEENQNAGSQTVTTEAEMNASGNFEDDDIGLVPSQFQSPFRRYFRTAKKNKK